MREEAYVRSTLKTWVVGSWCLGFTLGSPWRSCQQTAESSNHSDYKWGDVYRLKTGECPTHGTERTEWLRAALKIHAAMKERS